MVRAAAKNYNDVTVITNPNQYDDLIKELSLNKGNTTLNFREKMSEEAFSETAYYDSIVSNYFNKLNKNKFPQKKTIPINLIEKLRFTFNHMAFYLKFGKKLPNGRTEDLYPRLRELAKKITQGEDHYSSRAKKERPEGHRMPYLTERVRYEMLNRLGYFVTESSEHFAEYVPWFIKRDRPDLLPSEPDLSREGPDLHHRLYQRSGRGPGRFCPV